MYPGSVTRVLLLLALAGCPAAAPDPPPPPTDAPTGSADTGPEPTPTERLLASVEAAGWEAREGLFSFSSMDGCCAADANCQANNPTTPYGTWALPPAPGQWVPDRDLYWMWGSEVPSTLSRDVHLRPDEVVVWIGTAPPEAAYLSVRTYLSSRTEPSGEQHMVMGALGPSLNHLVLEEEAGAPIWGEPLVFVTAADAEREEQVVTWLREAGFAAASIHRDRIAASEIQLGLTEGSDTLLTLMRLALPADEAAMAAYRADPGVTLWRLTPPSPPTSPAPFARPVLLPRGTGTSETVHEATLDALEAAILARYPGRASLPIPSLSLWYQQWDCIEALDCQGNIHDRLSLALPPVRVGSAGEFVVVYGVHHVQSGKATYSSFAINGVHNTGVAAVTNDALLGSARPWLGDGYPGVDDVYAWVIARDCSAFVEPCLELQDMCPWPAPEDTFGIRFRLYLEPATGAAPLVGEVLNDRAVLVLPP